MMGGGAETGCRQYPIVSGAQLSTVMLHPVFVASGLWEDGGGEHTPAGSSHKVLASLLRGSHVIRPLQ